MTQRVLAAGALAVLLVACAGCFNSAAVPPTSESYSLAPDFDLTRTWRVALLPPASGLSAGDASGLYDHAGMMLMRGGKITLVDRGEVDRILAEQQFSSSGIVDPSTAARLGRLAGAEAVAFINVTSVKHDSFFADSPDQREAKLTLKVISVETAEVLYYAEGVGSSFEGAAEALNSALDVAVAPLVRKAGGE